MKNNIFFTPGPSQLYFTVYDHVKKAFAEQIPSISHRSVRFQKIYQKCVLNIKQIFDLIQIYHLEWSIEEIDYINSNIAEYVNFDVPLNYFIKFFFRIG